MRERGTEAAMIDQPALGALETADYIASYNLETEEWLMLPMPQAESVSWNF